MSEKKWLKKGFDHINDEITQWPDWKKAQLSEPPLNDHTMNACLARVIGKTVVEEDVNGEKCWAEYGDNGELIDIWCPVADSNQMEEVEAWLIEKYKRLALTMHWGGANWHVTIRPYREKECEGLDPDKKRAFAMAIWAMEQPQTKESA